MKLSDMKGEKALEVLGDIIDPITEILSDSKVANEYRNNKNKLGIAKVILKEHPKSIIEILAKLNDEDVKKYNERNIIQITGDLLEMLNDEQLMSFFQSQGEMMANTSSGSVTENTKDK